MSHCPPVTAALPCSTAGEVTVQTVAIHKRSPSNPDGVAVLNTSQAGWQQSCGFFFIIILVINFFKLVRNRSAEVPTG